MNQPGKIVTVFGTRPEVIKLAPVIRALECIGGLQTLNVSSSQHTDLLFPLTSFFKIRIDRDLRVMQPDQTPNQVCALVLTALDRVLVSEDPSMLLVQGDTSTTLASALAAFHRNVPVAHVEAGLRSGSFQSPYPEEMNRQLVTKLATYHFAATPDNREALLSEGVDSTKIFVTGNPVVDSLQEVLRKGTSSPFVQALLKRTKGFKRLVLTTHRRESFGPIMAENMRVIRNFVEAREDVSLIFPVHPNPEVGRPANDILAGHPRINLVSPLNYKDFITVLSHAWLIVSDSGGVQEEAPTLRKPLLVLRSNTERPEVLRSGIAKLVGGQPETLALMLEEAYADESWTKRVNGVINPFGSGDSGKRIAQLISELVCPKPDKSFKRRLQRSSANQAPRV